MTWGKQPDNDSEWEIQVEQGRKWGGQGAAMLPKGHAKALNDHAGRQENRQQRAEPLSREEQLERVNRYNLWNCQRRGGPSYRTRKNPLPKVRSQANQVWWPVVSWVSWIFTVLLNRAEISSAGWGRTQVGGKWDHYKPLLLFVNSWVKFLTLFPFHIPKQF